MTGWEGVVLLKTIQVEEYVCIFWKFLFDLKNYFVRNWPNSPLIVKQFLNKGFSFLVILVFEIGGGGVDLTSDLPYIA